MCFSYCVFFCRYWMSFQYTACSSPSKCSFNASQILQVTLETKLQHSFLSIVSLTYYWNIVPGAVSIGFHGSPGSTIHPWSTWSTSLRVVSLVSHSDTVPVSTFPVITTVQYDLSQLHCLQLHSFTHKLEDMDYVHFPIIFPMFSRMVESHQIPR